MNKEILKQMLKNLWGNAVLFGLISLIVGGFVGVLYGIWKGLLFLFGERASLSIVLIVMGLFLIFVIFNGIRDWYRNAKREVEHRKR